MLVWDPPTRAFELEAEEAAREGGPGGQLPARRQRGHRQDGRDHNPPVGVGRARPREGRPGRSGVVPGHPAEGTTINHRKDDWRGWRLHRGLCGGESGRLAEPNRPRLSRALGRDLLAGPRRQVTAVPLEVRARAGCYRDVAHHWRVKAVDVGSGARRRRERLGHPPDEAPRQQAPRARLLELVQAELAPRDGRPEEHPKSACERMASRRFGRSLTRDARGRLRLNATTGTAEATDAGPFGRPPHDATLDAEEVAGGAKSLPLSEGGFRRMKTTGLPTRPLSHGRPPRILAHVQRCGRARRRPRAAEIRSQQTWRTIRQTVDHWQVGRSRRHGQTMGQSPQVTAALAEIVRSLRIPTPEKILDVSDETPAHLRASRQASKPPRLSS